MLLIIILLLFFLWCIISPFLPKEQPKQTPTVIHNNIHIMNIPQESRAPSQQEPKQLTSEEGLFGDRINNRLKL